MNKRAKRKMYDCLFAEAPEKLKEINVDAYNSRQKKENYELKRKEIENKENLLFQKRMQKAQSLGYSFVRVCYNANEVEVDEKPVSKELEQYLLNALNISEFDCYEFFSVKFSEDNKIIEVIKEIF